MYIMVECVTIITATHNMYCEYRALKRHSGHVNVCVSNTKHDVAQMANESRIYLVDYTMFGN